MESQIWSKVDDKFAYVLLLRGHQVHRLKVTGLMLKRKVQGVIEALQQGQEPGAVGAKAVESFDARTMTKAEVSPGNSSLKLQGGPDGATSFSYSTGDSNADAILQAIVAQSGKTFESTQEEIGVVEALIPPALTGVFAGIFWALIYSSATKMAAGEVVEAKGRRRGMQQLLIGVAQMLGVNGSIAAGVLLLVVILGWAFLRITRRPQRTVWLPASA